MKQSWLTFALTKNKSEIISTKFFSFFFFQILQPYFHLPVTSELSDNYEKILRQLFDFITKLLDI